MMPSRPGHAPRSRYDWSARARTTGGQAQRYSRFVTLMKRLLTVAAIGIILAVLAFFFISRQPRQLSMSYETLGRIAGDLTMVKPRLSGIDAQGKPFVITADTAVQDARNAKIATLRHIEADLALQKDGWLNARAERGYVDMDKGKLSLTGGIQIFSDNGYELHTDSAFIDLKANKATGPKVTGQGPLGQLSADRFDADHAANQFILSGNVRMTILGKQS